MARGVGELPAYKVVCLQTDTAAAADGHDHVTAVETWDPDGGRTQWTLVQVIAAVRDGEVFQAARTGRDGQAAVLEPAVCPRCPVATLLVDAEVRPPACS